MKLSRTQKIAGAATTAIAGVSGAIGWVTFKRLQRPLPAVAPAPPRVSDVPSAHSTGSGE